MKTNFIDSFQTNLNEFHLAKLKFIDNTDFTKVKEKVKKELKITSEEYLEEGIYNLKIYYSLPVLDPLNSHAISPKIDPFWHFHVLFTKDYIKFCNDLVGTYMHHEPLLDSDIEDKKRIRKLYNYTIQTNKLLFKSPNTNWWPEPNENDDSQLICSHNNFKPDNTNIDLRAIIENAIFKKDMALD